MSAECFSDKKLIKSIIDEMPLVPKNLAHPAKYMPYEECLAAVKAVVDDLLTSGQGQVDYGSAAASSEYNYYIQHTERFAQTLARIPAAQPGERVCEIGSLGVFSVLLQKVLGYSDITGLDLLPGRSRVESISTVILGEEYTQTVLNADLNGELTGVVAEFGDQAFDKIFCFEVLEHLWHPMRVLGLFRSLLRPGGKLFISVPNCASALALRKLLAMQIPMVWNAFDEVPEKAHFKEYTPLALKYVLAHSGFAEDVFDTMYVNSSSCDCNPQVQWLYPFPGNSVLNTLLQGDTLFSVSSPAALPGAEYPDMLYNTGAYQASFYGLYPDSVELRHFFSDELSKTFPEYIRLQQEAEHFQQESERLKEDISRLQGEYSRLAAKLERELRRFAPGRLFGRLVNPLKVATRKYRYRLRDSIKKK